MELIQIGKNTYYIKNNTNIGIYKINEKDIYLIDTGNDTDAGKKILKIINDNNFTIKGIINTHSHADHIGGNNYIQNKTNTNIYAHKLEQIMTEYTIFEPSILYGGNPYNDIKSKFLMAKPSNVLELENNIPECLEMIKLYGHTPNMIGIKTNDDVYFIGDSLISEETINKYHLFYIFDIKEYLNTLDYLSTLKGKYFIASHIDIKEDINDLININRNKIYEICNTIINILDKDKTFEELLKNIFEHYNLVMNITQYSIIGSVLKSYITYLINENKIEYYFDDNKLIYKKVI